MANLSDLRALHIDQSHETIKDTNRLTHKDNADAASNDRLIAISNDKQHIVFATYHLFQAATLPFQR